MCHDPQGKSIVITGADAVIPARGTAPEERGRFMSIWWKRIKVKQTSIPTTNY
jgi:hypothetical protein